MQLLLDPLLKRAVLDLKTDAQKNFAQFEFGETFPLEVGVVDALASTPDGRIWKPKDLTGWTFRAGIGKSFQLPTAGTFTVTFGGDTTPPLAFNTTAAGLETALNALASIEAAGFVAVAGNSPSYFEITFGDVGARSQLTSNTTDLAPLSIGEHNTLVDGDAGKQEIQTFRIFQNAAAYSELTTASDPAEASVATLQVGGGGFNHKVRVILFPLPYSGSWSVTVGGNETELLPFNATEDVIRVALEALASIGTGNVTVTREEDGQFLIGFRAAKADTNMGTIDADGSSLNAIPLMSGVMDLRTPGMELLLGSATSIDCFFEVEGTPPGGTPQKLFRNAVTVVAPIITPASLTPTPVVSFYTKAEVDAFVASITAVRAIRPLADAAAIAAATPDFIGQMAFDLTSTSYYWGTALTVGAWSGDFSFFNSITVPTGLIDFLTAASSLNVGKTITAAGTTGAQLINKTAGCVRFAAGASTLIVTNNLVTANSIIMLTVGANDATMKRAHYVPGAGSFTIYADGVPTAETRVDFFVVN